MFTSSRHTWSLGLGVLTLGVAVLAFVPPLLHALSATGAGVAWPFQPARQPYAVAAPVGPSSAALPAAASAISRSWLWVRTERGDGSTVVVSDPSKYAVTFQPDGQLTIQADCNRANGSYAVIGSELVFEPGPITAMGCRAGSQGVVFHNDLLDSRTFAFEGEQLILYLKRELGHMVLKPQNLNG